MAPYPPQGEGDGRLRAGISTGGNTLGTTGTVNQQMVFVGGNNITLSQSIASQSATITISAGAAAAAVKIFELHKGVGLVAFVQSQGDLRLQPMWIPFNMTATQLDIAMHIAAVLSGGLSQTLAAALYTYSLSTADTISTASRVFSYNSTLGTSNTDFSGTRYRSISLDSWAFTPGDYLLGILFSSATAVSTVGQTFFGKSGLSIVASELVGGGIAEWGFDGHGTVALTTIPASLHITDIARTGNIANRQPWVLFQGTQ